MAVDAFIAEVSDDPECRSTTDLATELLRTGRELAAAQCRWLTLLAEFDRRAGWAADGALSCVDWVVWRVGLARGTAKEKLRVESVSTGPAQRRVDALLDLVRAGQGQLDAQPPRADPDRYTLHLVADVDALSDRVGRAELVDGSPVGLETLRRVACDCGVVRHLVRGPSQPLDLGTRTPVWSTAQRRAIMVRDRGRCRFPSCWRRTCDVHHVVHFADGGVTAVDNGILLCPRHHTLVHERRFTFRGDAPVRLTFHRADGTAV